MAENKVQFNLKNVHYSVVTETVTTGGSISYTYATPVAVNGAVSLSLDQEGEITPFYADGMVYYNTVSNNGYSGSLEMARFPDQMLKDVWGFTEGTTSKVLTESSLAEPKKIALLYQIDGDADHQKYVLYNCTMSRPGIGGSTTEASKEPQTQTCDISAAPRADGKTMARTTATTPTETSTGWFTAVYVEA